MAASNFHRTPERGQENMQTPSSRPEPGYILVMGMTGSGKTTFISRLTGPHTDVGVGHSLSSSTIDATAYPVLSPHPPHRPLFLIDTPGFDDTTRSDASVLATIASTLLALHRARRPVLGIIVLHRITDVRLAGSAVKTFRVLQRLCGPANYDRVVLATTMWSDASFSAAGREAAAARQRRLREYWGRDDMFAGRSVVMRHAQDAGGSAWRVVEAVVALAEEEGAAGYRPLGIQVEMGERGVALEETAAGRYVMGELLEARRAQEGELRELERRVEEGAMVLRERKGEGGGGASSPDRVDQLQRWFVSFWTGLRSGSWWKAAA
ncbi:hypothetical protein QBC39DRAFT_368161 [Podospora conica]|nr:hypothetical protein QBC39DRAFT_368161 [Schizothecium conicum]